MIFDFFLDVPVHITYSPVLWTFTQRSVISQVETAFDHWIYNNHFRFLFEVLLCRFFNHVLLIVTN